MLIDTSVWISAIRGDAPVLALVDQLLVDRRAATNHIIVTELLVGTKTPQGYEELRDDLAALPHLALSEDIWGEGARLGFELRRKGVSTPLPDLIIAACAIVHRCDLWFLDQDFSLIARHAPLSVYQHNGKARR